MIFGDVKEILNLVREIRCTQIEKSNKECEVQDIYWKLEQLEDKIDALDLKKIETMLNEFKGCIAMSRATLKEVARKPAGRPKKAK